MGAMARREHGTHFTGESRRSSSKKLNESPRWGGPPPGVPGAITTVRGAVRIQIEGVPRQRPALDERLTPDAAASQPESRHLSPCTHGTMTSAPSAAR